MRIVVISDTHTREYKELPQELRNEIANSDAVIHAGDLGSPYFYEELCIHSRKLYSVSGNNDHIDIPCEIVTEFEGVKVAVVHGDRGRNNMERYLVDHFADENPALIIFGHTHKPYRAKIGDQTLLNPGSPTKNRGVSYNSFVILSIENGVFNIEFNKIL